MANDVRIKSLDITRGIAVMGILSVNIVAMAMISVAYFYPPAFGFDSLADRLTWLANFLLVDGKLRSLFSIMFGASTLLVVDRAIAAGRSPARTHYARMAVLLAIGYLHWLLFWWGDILTLYAAVGALAFLFHRARVRTLFVTAILLLALNGLPGYFFLQKNIAVYEQVRSGTADAETVATQEKRAAYFAPDSETLARDRAAHASLPAHARQMWLEEGWDSPFDFGILWAETLGLMLLGMGLYRTGFLTGALDPATYRKVAFWTLPTGLAAYAGAAWFSIAHDYGYPYAMGAYGTLSTPFRATMAVGYAALVILLSRRGRATGWWADRLAAVGRTAFSNYLFSTLAGILIFYGFAGDLYGQVSRFEAWLFVPPLWLSMLLWSKPWLDRFHYGPLEWTWRSLARGGLQPMRKRGRFVPTLAVTGD